MIKRYALVGLAGLLALAACRPADDAGGPLFVPVPPEESGVTFANTLEEREGFNVLDYEYFYNGGGVAVGDVDGDGRPDLFFTANMEPNRLYLNKGGWRFEDVTEAAGVGGPVGWTTGATMADVDGDGDLDLYVCRSGDVRAALRRNLLYLNDGDGTFTEAAAELGLDDPSHSTHASFFDYDLDGDLDAFVLNHSIRRLQRFDVALIKAMRDSLAGDKLYRNDGGRFVDVSEEAGIIGNPIGFGLSATVGDLNGDGWPDLYVANDYDEDDYLYLNNSDGTFTESVRDVLGHTSFYSMGADIADVNNDARPDLFTLDMLPEDNERQKLLKGPDNYDKYRLMLGYGYHHQFMRNMLHVNTGVGPFSEVGQLAGVSNTDWSWSALFADYDLDGHKDLFVTNGYRRDYTNMDFLKYTVPEAARQAQERGETLDVMTLVEQMPSSDVANYAFRNRGDLTFEKVTEAWGLGGPLLSNGAAYGDLDGDGDLDLVVNNIDAPAALYRNDVSHDGRHFLKVRLEGEGGNRFGVGAAVTMTTPEGSMLHQEMMPARGYQSSVEPVLLFGLGEARQATVRVRWPNGAEQLLPEVAAGQTLVLRQADAHARGAEPAPEAPRHFARLPDALGLDFVHQENDFIDFKREPLLPHMLSRLGPALAAGDVNRDGLDDVYVGGALGQEGQLFLQQASGTFAAATFPDAAAHAAYEDTDALFFDADGDGDLDLYVVSGGSAETDLARYQDRLYLNNGFGALRHAPEALPAIRASGSVAAAHDADGDGDLDLFVGGRVLPGRYPYAPRSYLLRNEGGRFEDATAEASADLLELGLVTAAAWGDLDGDGRAELVVAGEWMPVRVFRSEGGWALAEATEAMGLGGTSGWWNCVRLADLDGDGDLDLVAGNRGRNAQMQASPEEPATIHAADFDGNGAVDPIISYYIGGESYPAPARDELLDQINALKRRYTDYASYANATVYDLFSETQLAEALVLEAVDFETSLFENQDGVFVKHALPIEAQVAPVTCILVRDLDRDGQTDLLLAGNNFAARAQTGRYDAGRGLFLKGRGDLSFEPVPTSASGFLAPGDVRDLALVTTARGSVVLVANNDAGLDAFAVL